MRLQPKATTRSRTHHSVGRTTSFSWRAASCSFCSCHSSSFVVQRSARERKASSANLRCSSAEACCSARRSFRSTRASSCSEGRCKRSIFLRCSAAKSLCSPPPAARNRLFWYSLAERMWACSSTGSCRSCASRSSTRRRMEQAPELGASSSGLRAMQRSFPEQASTSPTTSSVIESCPGFASCLKLSSPSKSWSNFDGRTPGTSEAYIVGSCALPGQAMLNAISATLGGKATT
mmetsp:Transcript_50864/g.146072  ORF Transcript_50864/g.146072 Transcript_50864/m.146072 type:complete len:234 (+) Transcript_50864:1398-2099(+)